MRHPSTPKRVEPDDSVVQGMEAVFALVLFLGLGVLLDRWLDTAPVFTIGMMLLGAVGVFFRFKYAYIARMDRLDADRRGRSNSGSGPGSAPESKRVVT
jgi:F0F1-type ATP synthase assembly protein I